MTTPREEPLVVSPQGQVACQMHATEHPAIAWGPMSVWRERAHERFSGRPVECESCAAAARRAAPTRRTFAPPADVQARRA